MPDFKQIEFEGDGVLQIINGKIVSLESEIAFHKKELKSAKIWID